MSSELLSPLKGTNVPLTNVPAVPGPQPKTTNSKIDQNTKKKLFGESGSGWSQASQDGIGAYPLAAQLSQSDGEMEREPRLIAVQVPFERGFGIRNPPPPTPPKKGKEGKTNT
eukprot:995714-Amphidinium_carterae.1